MAYFDCQIVQGSGGIILTVECSRVFAGATITATDGETTLIATCPSSSPYEVQFNIPNVGTWTISGTYAGDSYSTQVVIPSSATLSPVPNGSTVTPTDDIETWLHCADIWDKNYTTISQVLADSTTLLALISSNNAVDYMARSTSWASSVTADSAAMTLIGISNYCADTLLADSTWRTAICDSTYFESVLNVKVPTMTSDTTPSGVCSGSSIFASYYKYWGPFSNESVRWCPVQGESNSWVGYEFTSPVLIYLSKFSIIGNTSSAKPYKIQYKDENNSWVDITDPVSVRTGDGTLKSKILNAGTRFRLICTGVMVPNGDSDYAMVDMLQFYGRAVS